MSFQNFRYNSVDTAMVSVSKLCCPVCWELFNILGMKKSIRGCHPTVTPIALPETFSNEVNEMMVTRFRTILCSQLRHLSASNIPFPTSHHHNSSESGYSAASSNEGAREYPELDIVA